MTPFFDSNILIYGLVDGEPRQEPALKLLAAGGAISVQVLNEVATVARRKLGMNWAEVDEALRELRTFFPKPAPLTVVTHEAAIELAAQHNFPFYDALIVAAALAAKCTTLYSEDMHHGMMVGGSCKSSIRSSVSAAACRSRRVPIVSRIETRSSYLPFPSAFRNLQSKVGHERSPSWHVR